MFPCEQRTIVETSLAKDGRYEVVMAIDGPHRNVMTICEVHWSLSTGTLFSVSVSKNRPAFSCKILAGITAFCLKIAAVNLNSQKKFYDNGASVLLRRITAVSAELPAIYRKRTENLKKNSTRLFCGRQLHLKKSFYRNYQKHRYTVSILNYPPHCLCLHDSPLC